MDEGHLHLKGAEKPVLHVSAQEIGAEGAFELDRNDDVTDARVTYTSREFPVRTAGLALTDETLAVHFFIERKPDLQILQADDYEIRDDGYAEGEVREVVRLIAAFLRGEGSVEPRRTILGRRRVQLRLHLDDRRWIAR
ncbi:hypothetical protein [Nocardioides aurantiacus]|uniref:Uncharacterized protein n=1 Tax=Nocardioides aurantiacus TaxID=86796 RepID=A0A3N2CU45_9ACTN|nr:hypothetical protein [Nocardioides aurantiacus]ROR91055.1 hypothetical protein EDD33_1915 [Nocardioides aurantiacus]